MPLSPRDRKALMVGGIILGVLVLGLIAFTLTQGGGDDQAAGPDQGSIVVPSGAPVTPSASPSPAAGSTKVPDFTGRDPFSVPPGLGPSDASGSEDPSGGTDTPTDSPSGPTTTPPSGPTTTPPTGPTTTPPTTTPPTQGGRPGPKMVVGGETVTLLDVFRRSGIVQAQVAVNSTVYIVRVGQTFANGEFQLRSIVKGCATFLHGDEAFTLCVKGPK